MRWRRFVKPRSSAPTGPIRSSAWRASSFSGSRISTAARCAGTGAAARLHADRTRDRPARRRLSRARQQPRPQCQRARRDAAGERLSDAGRPKPINARWSSIRSPPTLPNVTENIRGTQRAHDQTQRRLDELTPPVPDRARARARRTRRVVHRSSPEHRAERRPCIGGSRTVGVTVVTAADRDQPQPTDRARTARCAACRARGHVPVRGARDHVGAHRPACTLTRSQPIATGRCRDQPERRHEFVRARPAARSRRSRMRATARSAATRALSIHLSQRERGEDLPNVGALLDAKIDTTAVSRPLLTRQDLAAIKPLAIRPHARGAPATGRPVGRDLLVLRLVGGAVLVGDSACTATICCCRRRIC